MRYLPLILLLLTGCTGCTVEAQPAGTHYVAPCEESDTSPLPGPFVNPTVEPDDQGATPATVSFKAGQVYFFCPDFPCPACDRIDEKYVKIKPPYPAGFEWVKAYGYDNGWPVMYWKGKDNWHRRVGYESVDKTEAIVNPPKVQPRQGYPIRGSWWTHPGDVWSHLMQSPHNFSADYVRTLSRSEAESLHSDDHEGRVNGNPPRRGQTYIPTSYQPPVQRQRRQSRLRATPYYCPPGSS